MPVPTPSSWYLLRRLLSTDPIVVLRGPDEVDVFVPVAGLSAGTLSTLRVLMAGDVLPQELLDEMLQSSPLKRPWTFFHAAPRGLYVYLCPPGASEPVRFSVVSLSARHRDSLVTLQRGDTVPPALLAELVSAPSEPRRPLDAT